MERVCRLCNGMSEVHKKCSFCGSEMDDGGVLSDYYGPYSPYASTDMLTGEHMTTYDGEKCIHLLVCPVCGADTRVSIDLVSM